MINWPMVFHLDGLWNIRHILNNEEDEIGFYFVQIFHQEKKNLQFKKLSKQEHLFSWKILKKWDFISLNIYNWPQAQI